MRDFPAFSTIVAGLLESREERWNAMKKKWDGIKWEVVITFVISLTSIFVAIKANNISKMQTEIARKNFLFHDSIGGAKSSAIVMSP